MLDVKGAKCSNSIALSYCVLYFIIYHSTKSLFMLVCVFLVEANMQSRWILVQWHAF